MGNSLCGTLDAEFVQQDGQQRVVVEQVQPSSDGSVQLPACSGALLLQATGTVVNWTQPALILTQGPLPDTHMHECFACMRF